MRISHSAMETFKQCPYKYKLNQIDKIPEPKSEEAVFGSYLHFILQWFFENDYRKITLKDLISFYEKHWNEIKYFDSKSQKEKSLNNFYFDEGIMMLKNFYQKNGHKNVIILSLENPFEISIHDNNDQIHIISGIIDRIQKTEDRYEIMDYKTGKRLPTQNKVDQNSQLSIYALAFLDQWPNINIKSLDLSLYFLKFGEIIKTKRTLDDLIETKTKILKTIKDIQKEKAFCPKPNNLCDWCGYKNICPVFKHYQPKPQIEKDEINIKNLMDKYFDLHQKRQNIEKEIDIIKTKVDNYLVAKNLYQLESEQGCFQLNDQESCTYEWKKIKNILKPLGKWTQLIKIDQTEFKKIMREIPEDIRNEINNCKIVKNKTKVITAIHKSENNIFKNGDINKNIQSRIYDDFTDL